MNVRRPKLLRRTINSSYPAPAEMGPFAPTLLLDAARGETVCNKIVHFFDPFSTVL